MAAIWSRDLVSIATDIQQTLTLASSCICESLTALPWKVTEIEYFQSLAFFRCVAQRTKWRECVLYMWGKWRKALGCRMSRSRASSWREVSARDFSVREGWIFRNRASERRRGCSLGFPMAKRVLTRCELNDGSRLRSGAGSCQCWFSTESALTVYMLWWASGKRKEGGTERRGGSWRDSVDDPSFEWRQIDVYFDISLRV